MTDQQPVHPTRTASKGLLMGLADAVPGVSGGTIAFIVGIHPRLVGAIANLHPRLLVDLVKRPGTWSRADLGFLMFLGLGIGVGLLGGATVVDAVLHRYPVALMAFLMGMVAASIQVPARVPTWRPSELAWGIGAGIVAFAISVIPGAGAPTALWFLPVAGAIAACAMILPGISGSYLLVLMGLYATVIGAVAELDLLVIALVGLGAVIGLLSFSRLLRHLFQHHIGATHAAMVGLLGGSLIRLWPWRDASGFAEGSPVMPDVWSPLLWLALGAALSLSLDVVARRSATQKA